MSGYRHRRRKRYRQKEATGERPKAVSYRICIGEKKRKEKKKKRLEGCVCGLRKVPGVVLKPDLAGREEAFCPWVCCWLLVLSLLLVACCLLLPVPWLAGSQRGMGMFLKMARKCSNS